MNEIHLKNHNEITYSEVYYDRESQKLCLNQGIPLRLIY